MAFFCSPKDRFIENHHRLVNRCRFLGNRNKGKLNIIQRYLSHSLFSQFPNNVPPHFGCIIRQGRGTHMDRLHQQPLFAILGNRRRFTSKRRAVDLLKSCHFLFVNFLAGLSIKNNALAVCVLNVCFVILIAVYLNLTVSGNSFSFFSHFLHLRKIVPVLYFRFIRTALFPQRCDLLPRTLR